MYNKRFARFFLRNSLRQLFSEKSTEITIPGSAWGAEYTLRYRLVHANPGCFQVCMFHVDHTDNAELICEYNLLSKLVASLWKNVQDQIYVRNANLRHWRIMEKLAQ